MKLTQFMRKLVSKETWGYSEGGMIASLVGGAFGYGNLPGATDFERLSEEGFRRNAIVHACIRRISRSVAEAPLKAVTVLPNGDLRTDSHKGGDRLAKLIHTPNADQDQYELFEQLLIHLYVAGNAFIHKVRAAAGGPPVALELLRPDRMGLVPGQTRSEGKVKYYTFKLDESDKHLRIAKNDIIHIKMPDALDEYWGLSPVYTAARYADIDIQTADFLRAFFRNKGIPSGLLTFDKQMVATERNRIKELWKEQFQGEQGWNNVAVLDASVEYKPLTSGIEKLDMSTVTSQTETRICMIFGVPPVLIGSMFGLEKSTFSNLDGAEKIFWQDTLSPIFARLSRKLTRELAEKEFNDDRQAIFDLSQVAALQENRSEIRKIALQGFNFGLLTTNESLKLLGLPQRDEGGDVVKVVPGSILIPVGDIKPGVPVEPTSSPSGADVSQDNTQPTTTGQSDA